MRFRRGQSLGSYELVRPLGKGAFAEVWLASHQTSLGFNREVALKVLRPERVEDPRSRADLIAEAVRLSEMNHPNIVQVHGIEELEGTLVVAMEFVEGGSLLELLRAAHQAGLRFPRSVVLDLGIQLCEGLDYAWNGLGHDDRPFRMVHRDLKPANLLLTPHGGLKIVDFGIARRLGDPTQTATGTLKGTPCYVAPETLRGERRFTPAVDLFAVGCILAELWTGQVLFASDSLPVVVSKVVMGTAEADVAPFRSEFPELADWVEAVLRRDPDQRLSVPSEARARLVALRHLATDDPDLKIFRRLLDQALRGDRASMGPCPTVDAEWRALWRRVDPSWDDSATGFAPRPVLPELPDPPTADAPFPPPPDAGPDTSLAEVPASSPKEPVRQSKDRVVAALIGIVVALVGLFLWVLLEAPNRPLDLASTAVPLEPASDGASRPSTPRTPVPTDSNPESSPTPLPEAEPSSEEVRSAAPAGESAVETPPSSGRPVWPEPDPTSRSAPTDVEPGSSEEGLANRPVVPRSRGCLGVVTDVPSASLFLDDVRWRGRTATGTPTYWQTRPGEYLLGMGRKGEPEATAPVTLLAGETVLVECRLAGGSTRCETRPRGGWACE